MITGIYHVGIAVHSVDEALEKLKLAFGAHEIRRREIPSMGQISCLVKVGNSFFELMEATRPDGVIGKYIEKHGVGVHHISMYSDNLEEDLYKIEKSGGQTFGRGKDNYQEAAFVHPKSLLSVLFEISNPFRLL